MSKMILEIDGMSCSHCVNHVKNALLDLDGVDVLDVEVGKAIIDADANVTEEELRDLLEEEGYELISIE
ncbi:heavy-metal-associated domain-containing protein [Clostridium tarantellae]|uniref:Heavy-metal-associated domain-containing protein n=1 Tax=Clostridium tarantellae TaxID=39493 RepID=A0A6I1MKU2_9CLOT|nr:cation transporter [Clostridium tarantellae]MPQ43594.1 heavy-metal-associated domain-containing protein [Clostridium tarantellae]